VDQKATKSPNNIRYQRRHAGTANIAKHVHGGFRNKRGCVARVVSEWVTVSLVFVE
jgi:hypothetical protein